MSKPAMDKREAMDGFRKVVEGFRSQAEAIGLSDVVRRLDAALLLEDEEKILHYSTRMLIELRAVLVSQVEAIDGLLKR